MIPRGEHRQRVCSRCGKPGHRRDTCYFEEPKVEATVAPRWVPKTKRDPKLPREERGLPTLRQREQPVCAGWKGPCPQNIASPVVAFTLGAIQKRRGEPYRCMACAAEKRKDGGAWAAALQARADRRADIYKQAEAVHGQPIIYVIRAGDSGPVKIGWSNQLLRRIKELQIANPWDLQLLAQKVGTREEEAALKERFASYRTRRTGEWFREEATEEILACFAERAA